MAVDSSADFVSSGCQSGKSALSDSNEGCVESIF